MAFGAGNIFDFAGQYAAQGFERQREEEERKRRYEALQARRLPDVAPEPQGSFTPEEEGGGFGRAFLATLLQSAPAISQIMTAKSSEDIQRALADHSSMLERYRESRALEAERRKEREFASEQAQEEADRRKAERNEDRAFDLELFERGNEADEDRFNRRNEADQAAAAAARSERQSESRTAQANEIQADLGWAQAEGHINSDELARELEMFRQTGQYTERLTELMGIAAAARDAHEEAQIMGRRGPADQVLSPEQARLQSMTATVDHLREIWEKTGTSVNERVPFAQYVDAQTGLDGYYQNYIDLQTGVANAPPPPPPIGDRVTAMLEGPDTPEKAEAIDTLNSMDATQFRGQVSAMLAQSSQPDRLLRELIKRLDKERRDEVIRIMSELGGPGASGVDRAVAGVYQPPPVRGSGGR